MLAGIVLYNPDINTVKRNIKQLEMQGVKTVLIDNDSSNIIEVEKVLEPAATMIIKNNENLGVAKALNQICEYAEKNSEEYVLLFDQDSEIPTNITSEYKKATARLNRIGVLCPVIKDKDAGVIDQHEHVSSKEYDILKKCITSGSLVSIAAWQSIDGYDENLFIDAVDFDFCKRLCDSEKYKIYRVNNVVLNHKIGNMQLRRFLFWKVHVGNHNAFRKYYIGRNITYLSRKYNGKVSTVDNLRILKQLIIIALYEKNAKSKIKAFCKGVKDGRTMSIK